MKTESASRMKQKLMQIWDTFDDERKTCVGLLADSQCEAMLEVCRSYNGPEHEMERDCAQFMRLLTSYAITSLMEAVQRKER